MLVLARQPNERIIMPSVPATIEVVAVKATGVRLGIEAPPEVPILREEVLLRGDVPAARLPEPDAGSLLHRVKRLLRNRLQNVALGLGLLRQQMDTNPGPASLAQRLEDEVGALDRQLRALLDDLPREPARAARAGEMQDGLAI